MDDDSKRRLTLGKFLQQVREKKSLTIKDVADELRLKLSTIKALEEDDYQHVGNLVYVKGYLKSYAKLLGVNIDKGLAELSEQTETVPPPLMAAKKNIEQTAKKDQFSVSSDSIDLSSPKKDKLSILIVLVIICMLLGIAYIFYERYHMMEMIASHPGHSESMPVASVSAAPTIPEPAAAAPSVAVVSAPVVSAPAVSAPVVSAPIVPPTSSVVSAPSTMTNGTPPVAPSPVTVPPAPAMPVSLGSIGSVTENQPAGPHFEPPIVMTSPSSAADVNNPLPQTLTTTENIVDNH